MSHFARRIFVETGNLAAKFNPVVGNRKHALGPWDTESSDRAALLFQRIDQSADRANRNSCFVSRLKREVVGRHNARAGHQ